MNAKKLLNLQAALLAGSVFLLWFAPEKIVWTFEFAKTPNLTPYINFITVLILSLAMLSSVLANLPENILGDVCAAFGTTHLLFLIAKIHQVTTGDDSFDIMAALSVTMTLIFILLFFNEYRKLKIV